MNDMPIATGQRHAAPIPFDATAGEERCRARHSARLDNDAHEALRLRTELMLRAAHDDGHSLGERWGYTQGFHWGMVCGVVAGAIGVGVLWILWPTLQAALSHWGM